VSAVDGGEPRFAVVGHVEWVSFARVEHVPRAGEVVHAREPFEEPAGGGAVAAVQLARLDGRSTLHTVLGADARGDRAESRLRELGVAVAAQRVADPTRWAVTLVDARGERTITTFGARLEPRGDAGVLAGDQKRTFAGIYFTAGDLAALRRARDAAHILVASPRARRALGHGVRLDALIFSADDPIEREAAGPALDEADVVIVTAGAGGGSYRTRDGQEGRWSAQPPPGPVVDSYGAGDSFAAGVTYGLGSGMALAQALRVGALCGAACLTGRGPYERQLRGAELAAPTWEDAERSAGETLGGS
jgi:ribokinase